MAGGPTEDPTAADVLPSSGSGSSSSKDEEEEEEEIPSPMEVDATAPEVPTDYVTDMQAAKNGVGWSAIFRQTWVFV